MDERQLMEMIRGFQTSRILLTACELDIFSALGERWKSSQEVAAVRHTDERATDRLMNALTALGLLEKKDNRFCNTTLSGRLLNRKSPQFFAMVDHLNHLWNSWSGLTEAIRLGKMPRQNELPYRDDEWFEAFIAAMHYRGKNDAPKKVAQIDLAGVERVLDVGGGSAVFSMALLDYKPTLKADIFDLPQVCSLAQKYIEQGGYAGKIGCIPGNFHTDELPTGYDMVLLSAIIHSNSPQQNRSLFTKIARALNSGGQIVIFDFIMDESRTTPPFGAIFALNMLVATSVGDTYTEKEVQQWLTEAGFSSASKRSLEFGVTALQAKLLDSKA